MANKAPSVEAQLAAINAQLTEIKDCLTALETSLSRQNTAEHQATQLLINTVTMRLNVLEATMSNQKKPIARSKAESAPAPEATTVTNATAPVITAEKFPANVMLYFRSMYKSSEEFRQRFTTPELAEKMAAVNVIQTKTGDQKIIAESTYIYNCLKESKGEVWDTLNADFKRDKEAHANANKTPQQTVETPSPV